MPSSEPVVSDTCSGSPLAVDGSVQPAFPSAHSVSFNTFDCETNANDIRICLSSVLCSEGLAMNHDDCGVSSCAVRDEEHASIAIGSAAMCSTSFWLMKAVQLLMTMSSRVQFQ